MRGPYPWERDQVTALQREAGIWSRPDRHTSMGEGLKADRSKGRSF